MCVIPKCHLQIRAFCAQIKYNNNNNNNNNNKGKVKGKVHPRTRHKGPEGVEYSYSFFNLGARWGWVVNATPRPLSPRERDPLPIVQEAGWAPGPVWTGVENLALTGILSPDLPSCSESLYRLSYTGSNNNNNNNNNNTAYVECEIKVIRGKTDATRNISS